MMLLQTAPPPPPPWILHDPIQLVVIVVGIIIIWATMRNDVKWHTDWIKKHSAECDDQRHQNSEILTQLQVVSERLSVLAESNAQRITRLENASHRGGRS